MASNLFALVDRRDIVPESRHREGLPPEVTGGMDERRSLPWPKVLLIEERSDGVFLIRYAKGSVFAGDTWHQTADFGAFGHPVRLMSDARFG